MIMEGGPKNALEGVKRTAPRRSPRHRCGGKCPSTTKRRQIPTPEKWQGGGARLGEPRQHAVLVEEVGAGELQHDFAKGVVVLAYRTALAGR